MEPEIPSDLQPEDEIPKDNEGARAAAEHAGEHWMSLAVDQLLEGPLAEAVQRYLYVHNWKAPYSKKGGHGDLREASLPVTARIRISAYLQQAVPEELRTKTIQVRSPGEIYVESARMFAAVYAEDHRLGGDEPNPSAEAVNARV